MTKHLFAFAFCLSVVTILGEEPLPPYDPSKDNMDATFAALRALDAEVPEFRGTFVYIVVDARRVNDARIVALVEAFKKNGLQGVEVFESRDQIAKHAARYEWIKGLSYIEAYKTDSQREEPRKIKLP